MGASEWLAVVGISVTIVGATVAWMIRISRQLARIEAIVERLARIEDAVSEVQRTVNQHGERISVLEAK